MDSMERKGGRANALARFLGEYADHGVSDVRTSSDNPGNDEGLGNTAVSQGPTVSSTALAAEGDRPTVRQQMGNAAAVGGQTSTFVSMDTLMKTLKLVGPEIYSALKNINTVCDMKKPKDQGEKKPGFFRRLLEKPGKAAARAAVQEGIAAATDTLQRLKPQLRTLHQEVTGFNLQLEQAKGHLATVGQRQAARGLRGVRSHVRPVIITASRKAARADVKRLKGAVSYAKLQVKVLRGMVGQLAAAKTQLEGLVSCGALAAHMETSNSSLFPLGLSRVSMAEMASLADLTHIQIDLEMYKRICEEQDRDMGVAADLMAKKGSENRALLLAQEYLEGQAAALNSEVVRARQGQDRAQQEVAAAQQRIQGLATEVEAVKSAHATLQHANIALQSNLTAKTEKLEHINKATAALQASYDAVQNELSRVKDAFQNHIERGVKLAQGFQQLQGHVKGLTEQRDAAAAAKGAAEVELKRSVADVQALKVELKGAKEAKGKLDDKVRTLEGQVEEFKQKQAAAQEGLEAVGGLKEKVKTLEGAYATIDYKLARARHNRDIAEIQRDRLRKDYQTAVKTVRELQEKVQGLEEEALQREAEVEVARQEGDQLINTLSAEKAALEGTLQQVKNASKAQLLEKIQTLTSALQEAEANEAKQHTQRSRLQNEVNQETKKVAELTAKLAELQKSLDQKVAEIDSQQLQISSIQKGKAQADRQVKKLEGQLAGARDDINTQQRKVLQLSTRIHELGRERDHFKVQAGGQQAVEQENAVLRATIQQLQADAATAHEAFVNMSSQLVEVYRAKNELSEHNQQLLQKLGYNNRC